MKTGNFPSPSSTLIGAENNLGFSTPFIRTFYQGQSTSLPARLNYNASYLENLAFYSSGNGIVSALNLSMNGTNIEVSPGLALVGALVERVAIASTAGPTVGNTKYVWLSSSGTISTTGTDTAPANTIRLGDVTLIGATYLISTSYVLRIQNGVSYVKVPLTGFPPEDYGADVVIMADGIYTTDPWGLFMLNTGVDFPSICNNYMLPESYSITTSESFTCNGNMFLGGNFYGI